MCPAQLQGALPRLPPAVAEPGSSQDRQPEEPQSPHSLYLGCRELAWSFLYLFHLKTAGNWCKQIHFPGLITSPSTTAVPWVSLGTVCNPSTCVEAEEGGDGGLPGARLWEQPRAVFPLRNSGGCFELGTEGLREETREKIKINIKPTLPALLYSIRVIWGWKSQNNWKFQNI